MSGVPKTESAESPMGNNSPRKKRMMRKGVGFSPFISSVTAGKAPSMSPANSATMAEGEQIQKKAHAKETRRKPHDAAEGDGQKKARALLEAAEDAAEGIEEFFIEAEDDGDRRPAHPRHD